MELRHVRYFVVLAEELHYGRAAKRLNIAQPSLSQQVKKLEREIGVQLLDRSSRHVRLTHEGSLLLEHAERVLDDALSFRRLADKASRGLMGSLRVGAVSPATFSLLPQTIRNLVRRRPEIDIMVDVMDTPQQVDALLEDRLDVGIARPWVHSEEIVLRELCQERMLLAVPSTHRLAGLKEVGIGEVAGEPFFGYRRQRGAGYNDLINDICNSAGFYPRIRQELDEIYTIAAMVSAELGVALVPEQARFLQIPGVTYLKLTDTSATAPLCVAWREGNVSALAKAFIAEVSRAAQSVTDYKSLQLEGLA